MTYSIRDISKMFDLPSSTLRYYEEIGLLTDVKRDSGNQRVYNEDHLGQLYAINCFKRTGMPVMKIREFMELSRNIDGNIDQILSLLINHEQVMEDQLQKMHDDLLHIRHKIRFYGGIRKAIEENKPWPVWEDFEEDNDEQQTKNINKTFTISH